MLVQTTNIFYSKFTKSLLFNKQDQDQSWLRTHISWKAYRDLVNDAVMDIALRELLNGYVPFESRKKRQPRDDGSDQGPTLEQVREAEFFFVFKFKRCY